MYPVTLGLRGRPVLVVGGGEVALRKVEGLLAEGARVTVVAPAAVAAVDDLARRGAIELRRRPHRAGDVAGFALVFAATDDRAVNARVCRGQPACHARTAGVSNATANDRGPAGEPAERHVDRALGCGAAISG